MAVSTNPVALDETLQATNEKLNDIKTVLQTANFGRGIDSITKTSTSGLVDTYTIEYTDETTSTYTVTNGRNGTDGTNGRDGTDGVDGQDGADGADGFSPVANVEKVGSTATITVIDKDGTTTATISDGTDGTDGQDGTSLTATSSKVGKVTTVLIKNSETEETLTTLTINDGADGQGAGDMTKAIYDTNDDGIVDSAATLDGLTASVAELNYMDGVTSNVQTQINGKVSTESGKGLSSNDYTTEEKTKLSGISVGAEVNVIGSVDSDFSVSSGKQLSLSSAIKDKLNNFDISGSLTTALADKAAADDLDSWSTERTLASGNTFTFSGLNDNYGYKLFCDAPKAYPIDITQTGTTVVYTMGGDGLLVGTTKGKLRVIK